MLARLRDRCRRWYGAVEGAVRGHVNRDEAWRIAQATVGAGLAGGCLYDQLIAHAGDIFPRDPWLAAIFAGLLTLWREYRRRRDQADHDRDDPSPPPPAAPARLAT